MQTDQNKCNKSTSMRENDIDQYAHTLRPNTGISENFIYLSSSYFNRKYLYSCLNCNLNHGLKFVRSKSNQHLLRLLKIPHFHCDSNYGVSPKWIFYFNTISIDHRPHLFHPNETVYENLNDEMLSKILCIFLNLFGAFWIFSPSLSP